MTVSDSRHSFKVHDYLSHSVNMNSIYETYEFRTKMQAIHRMDHLTPNITPPKRRHSSASATEETFKFEFNMADETSSVDGSWSSHMVGGDASNRTLRDGVLTADGQVNGCAHRRPFLIGVAGGTASGKVRLGSY